MSRPGPVRPRIVVTRRLPAEVERRADAAFDAVLNVDDRPLGGDALRRALCEADGVLATVTDRLDADVLDVPGRRATIIANFGVGYDHVDLDAATRLGIVVTNTPGVLTDDTADLAIALMLMAARRAGEGERQLRAGRWHGWAPTHMLGTRVTGQTLGIVGFGRIGRAVAERAIAGFGMRVIFHQPRPADLGGLEAEACRTLDELLTRSDIVSLHCPATPETRNLIGAAALARMRPGAVLINTARGGIVDEAALAAALADGRLAAAGLDVYADEPQVHPALRKLENVVLLPHLGSATAQSRAAMGHRALDNLEAWFGGHTPPDRLA